MLLAGACLLLQQGSATPRARVAAEGGVPRRGRCRRRAATGRLNLERGRGREGRPPAAGSTATAGACCHTALLRQCVTLYPWSSGYDVNLTLWRLPYQSWVGVQSCGPPGRQTLLSRVALPVCFASRCPCALLEYRPSQICPPSAMRRKATI